VPSSARRSAFAVRRLRRSLQEPRTEGGLLSAAGFGLKHARLASIDGHAPAHRITAFVRRFNDVLEPTGYCKGAYESLGSSVVQKAKERLAVSPGAFLFLL